MWGQDTVFSRHTNVIRIIPTRVGTRENYASVCPFPKDHPHACGDKFRYLSMGCTTPGSSPRVWGQAIPDGTYKAKCRIIPTRVGTSTSIDTNAAGIMDHPHACGDKGVTSFIKPAIVGSSPRVWGQVHAIEDVRWSEGIIPTRVGTSMIILIKKLIAQDHPHACGDKMWNKP